MLHSATELHLLQGYHGCLNISQDSFYRNLSASEDPAVFNFDHPDAFAFHEIEACLRGLKNGTPVEM